jgi:hypothetical protein
MKHIRQIDPDTALTPWALRNMVLSGKIPSVQVGRKRLINIDTLGEYLTPTPDPAPPQESFGVIRPLRAR